MRIIARRQEPNCSDCAMAVIRIVETLDRISKPVFQISKDDIIETANSIGIPREKINWRTVEKYIEGYSFEGSYNIWDAIKEGLREGIKFPEDMSMVEVIDELDRNIREIAKTCKISDRDLEHLIIVLRQNAGQDLDELRKELRKTLQDYSRLSSYEMEDSGQTGAAIGAVAASAAATGLGSPELIPIVAPAGSAAGSTAEKELRKRIKF
jgi:hypothetical protein